MQSLRSDCSENIFVSTSLRKIDYFTVLSCFFVYQHEYCRGLNMSALCYPNKFTESDL